MAPSHASSCMWLLMLWTLSVIGLSSSLPRAETTDAWNFSLVHVADSIDEDEEQTEKVEGAAIGIDVGFTQSCVGVYRDGAIVIVPDEQGERILPSYVAFTESGEELVGREARTYQIDHPENTVYGVKRLIGRHWGDPRIQEVIERFPFKVVEKNSQPYIEVNTGRIKTVSPIEVTAMIITKLKKMAEVFLGETVTMAVLAVPAYFNDTQRLAMKDAALLAGLDVIRLVNEPIAAVLGYGMDQDDFNEHLFLVYDLSESDVDVSLIAYESGVFETLATAGEHNYGDEAIMLSVTDFLLDESYHKTGKIPRGDGSVLRRLRQDVGEAMGSELRSRDHAFIEMESVQDGQCSSVELTRAKWAELTMDFFNSTTKYIMSVLQDWDLRKEDIESVLLVTGSGCGHVPSLSLMVQDYFAERVLASAPIKDEFIVAHGATRNTALIKKSDKDISTCGPLLEVNPLSVGIKTAGGKMHILVHREEVLPSQKSLMFTTATDDQSIVTIEIYEGEHPLVMDNHLIGQFNLSGILPGPQGISRIRVTMDIDIDRNINVIAKEMVSGVTASIMLRDNIYQQRYDDLPEI